MGNNCLIMTDSLRKQYEEILKKYPEQCKRIGFNEQVYLGWVESYLTENNKPVDFVPETEALINLVEKNKNKDGKSFRYIPESIEYTPVGKKRQTYTVIGTRIYNKDGKVVFDSDSKDRRRIFANLAVQQGRAVVVEHKGKKYVVNRKEQIISVATGEEMKWGAENGDRKEILRLSQIAFKEKQKVASATDNLTVTTEGNENYVKQLIDHLKASGISVFDKAAMNKFFKEHPNTLIQQALEEQWEMQDIKAKAIADGTFMKAPNGKDTNLTERQWLQVRTKAFKKWFGDWLNNPASASKVVDKNGEPLIVYHYSDNENLTRFSTDFDNYFSQTGGTKKAVFFTEDNPSEKERNNNFLTKRSNKIAVFLNIKDLKTYSGTKEDLHKQGTNYREVVNKSAKENSIDGGLHMADFDDNKKEHQSIWIVHNPNQIKSATNNNGMFSTENDDIMMSIVDNSEKNSNFAAKSNNNKNERREILSERFTQEELRACTGILEETEALLQGRDESSVPEAKTEKTGDVELGKRQESILENWAKENNLWIENTTETLSKQYGEPFAEEGEATVYSKDGNTVVKAISLAYYIEPHLMLDRIVLHNRVAPDTALTLTHFGRNDDGEFVVVAEQPFVEGERPTQDEIVGFMASLGFKPYNKRNTDFINEEAGIIADDIHDENVIKTSNNAFLIIDGDFRINTANYNLNGTRTTKGNRNIQAYTTPQGEIYGFVDKEGNMYLDETIIDASHPIHEYTHLWDRALEKTNPQLWKRGISLMQEGVPGLWNEIVNSENYGKLWQKNGIKGDKLVNLIASEVHARLVGDNGAKLLDQIAKEKSNGGIIAKLKQWILDAWKELKATFSNWSQEEIDKLTLKDFNHMTVRDFADGINPNTVSSPSNAALTQNAEAFELGETEGLVKEAISFSLTPEEMAAAQDLRDKNKPLPERPKSVAYESALDVKDSRMAQFNRTFSPQQIKDRGAMISSIFSRILDETVMDEIDSLLDVVDDDTATEEEKAQAKRRINALKDPVNGRQLAAQEKGIDNIIKEIKQELEWNLEAAPEEMKTLWENTLDYFEELFNTQATIDIEEREGIRIIGLSVAEQNTSDEDVDIQNDGDDEVGHIVSGSDGWNFQVRYTNPFDSLSRKVRSMLYEIERPESEKDDLGQQRNYPMGQIYASLLSYLSKNMQDSDAFLIVDKSYEGQDRWGNDITETTYPNGYPTFPVLEEMKAVYPWVQQVIDRLTDDYIRPDWNTNLRYPSTGGSMASQFYTNFRKAYIPYGKIQEGDGKFGITPLNYEMEERAQYDKLEANYNNRMILTSHSIYNSDGTINKENAEWLKKQLESTVFDMDRNNYSEMPELMEYHNQHPEEETLTDEDIKEYDDFMSNARMLLQSFGIDATQDSVAAYLVMDNGKVLKDMLGDLGWIATTVSKVDDDKVDSFNYILDTRDRYGSNLWAHFFDGRGLITDASYMQSFYDSASKKTKYSYSADNYLMKTFRGACMGTLEQRKAYIDEHFGKYEWFKNQDTGEWRNKWLEFWYNYEGNEKEIPYRNVDNVTEYSSDGEVTIRPYMKWEPDDIWQVQSRSYDPESKAKTAFYLTPIFSDSPMSMTVKGPRMTMEELLYGTDENGKHKQGALVQLVNQELYRIGYVQDRAKAIEEGRIKPIANFDGARGLQFCFLPELNTYVFEDTREGFLERMTRLKSEKATMSEIEASQVQAIQDVINSKMGEYHFENSSHYDTENPLKAEQYYNMVYANAAIIQMTTVDLAFYKDDTDFQKRFKEVYAGGIQLNTNSKYGKKAENIILLSDDIITSPSYDKIAAIIDGSDSLSQEDKERIKATFTDINVADAQAFRSMHSFRSVLDMMGNWTDEMENALNHFKQSEWNAEDFDIIYQTIKPFVYSVIERNDGFGSSILVPQQNKNSEVCALMMYDLITNGLDASPVYKALSRFMEENLDADGNHLVDMAQFESAGKVGNQGVVNISFNPDKVIDVLNGDFYDTIEENKVADIIDNDKYEFTSYWDGKKYLDNTVENAERNYQEIKSRADYYLQNGEMSQEDYNSLMSYLRPTEDEIVSILEQAVLVTNPDGSKGINTEVVHTIPFDNYYQQQPTPEHHIDAEATFGSQTRNIIVADLPDDFEMSVSVKNGKHTFKGKDAVIDFYYELLNENLIEDFFGKGNKKGLKSIFSSKEALRDAVTEIVRGNPKYGRDFAEALQLDSDGNFVLSPNSPTIFTLMQEIVTSFFKNRITKQTINGAALIQAAGIGLDESLRLEFDEDGNLAGAHCLMPLTSKRFFEPLLETQVINGKEVKVLSPEKLKKAGLDKAIGYRIPTENKSSIMPLIVDGFTPLQNGSAIVLPAEITNIAGSDFDVDKMFIMLLSFYIQNYDMRKAREDYARENAIYNEILSRFTHSQLAEELLDDEPDDFKTWFEEHKDDYELDEPIIRKIEYDWNKTPKENGRKARNNMIIQMMYGILTSKPGSESVMNPQGFPDVKHAAKITRILTDHNLLQQLLTNANDAGPGVLPNAEQIVSEFLGIIQERFPDKYDEYKTAVLKMSAEQVQEAYLKAVTAGNNGDAIRLLMDSSTKDLEKFIKQYSAPESPVYPQTFAHSHARNMAGANQIGIYAIQGSMDAKFQRASERMREEQQFTINGRQIANVDVSDDGKRLKNVGQMIGASADNGKDPNLSDMGSTTKTAPMIGYMLRAGLSHLEAALIINQPYMKDSKYSSKNRKYWQGILGKNPLANNPGNISTEVLIKGLISPFELTAEEEKSIAGVCYRILLQHEAQEYMTQISRADSPNGAMANSYAKSRIQRYKVDLFQAKMGQRDFPFIRITEALSNTAVDTSASEDEIREQLKGQRMAFLHGMYALGINSFNGLVAPYFFGAREWFDKEIVRPILYNLNERLSDDKKEKIVNNIYTSYITYMLSGSSLFGNEEDTSMKEKRSYYLEAFPSEYQKIIQENEDIRNLLSSVLQVKQFGSRKRVILQDVGSLSKGQKQDVQRRFDSLVYSDNPVARNLAKDLLIYSYFDNGLQFTHDSFSHLFTTEFLTNFPVYNETLLKLDEMITPEERDNFIHQFLLTYPEAAYNVNSIISNDNIGGKDGDTIRIDLNDKNMRKRMINEVMSPNPQFEGINVYPYIQYNGDVFILDKDLFDQYPGTPVYRKLTQYQTFPRLPLFSVQMSVSQMAQEFPVNEEQRQSEELPSIGGVDAPMTHNEGSGDPNVGPDSMYDSFDSMQDYEAPDWGEMMGGEAQSPSETYQSEGQGELKEPFCQV